MGGAKNCPETPRQKMIGMMYLVLTAMLALNVSTDILSGFTMVDNSLHASIEASNQRNENMYQAFEAIKDKQGEKANDWYLVALQVKEKADALYNHLQQFKDDLAIMADGQELFDQMKAQGMDPTLHIQNNSNMDVTGTYALVEGKGLILKDSVASYSAYLSKVIDEGMEASGVKDSASLALRHSIQATLATNRGYNAHDKDSVDWEVAVFDGMPIGASMAVLSKMQNDVRTTEGQIVQFLMNQIGAADLRVNKLDAYVIPNSKNIMRGGTYSAQIILAAVDTTQTPDYYINGEKISAHGRYEVPANSLGLQQYFGYILVTNPNTNKIDTLHFSDTYMVSEPTATISNTELNVMYRGYDNKFSVSVPGVPAESVKVSASGATVRAKGKEWIIVPSGNANVNVTVSAEVDGKSMVMGKQEFRVKPLPTPNAYFKVGDKEFPSGDVAKSNLTKSGTKIIASYGPDGLLSVPFTVKSFMAIINGKTTNVTGDSFTAAQINEIQKLKVGVGATVVLQNIRAVGPGGTEKQLSPLILIVK